MYAEHKFLCSAKANDNCKWAALYFLLLKPISIYLHYKR